MDSKLDNNTVNIIHTTCEYLYKHHRHQLSCRVSISKMLVENALNERGMVALNVSENIGNLCLLEISEKGQKLSFQNIKNKKNRRCYHYSPTSLQTLKPSVLVVK